MRNSSVFLFIASRALLQSHAEFNRLLQRNFLTCYSCLYYSSMHLPTHNCRADCFKRSFFPCTLNDWLNLDVSIRNSESISIFKSTLYLLSFIRPIQSNIFNIFDLQVLKLLTLLRLGFSHLNKHRFRHNFQECMNQVCSCSLEIKNTSH